jgi:hypothetical protein
VNLSYERLIERLYEKGARSDCAMCGEDNWRGLGTVTTAQPMLLATVGEDGHVDPKTGFQVMGWACDNCGFVRLHSLDVLGG